MAMPENREPTRWRRLGAAALMIALVAGCEQRTAEPAAKLPTPSTPAPTTAAPAPQAPPKPVPFAPVQLPGKGLAQHAFLYAGEDKAQNLYIVKDGAIAWWYSVPNSKGEISDAVLRPNGNVLFAHQFGVTEVSADKHIVWAFPAPPGCEIHTAQPIGDKLVMLVQNGDPALLRVIDKGTGMAVLEFALPVKNPKSVHGQFRHARLTAAGTFLVAHMDLGKVCEYDRSGHELWSVACPAPWSAARLANGNTLIASNTKLYREVDAHGATVWELTQADLPDYVLVGTQLATRLANGNTLINNWWNNWSRKVDPDNAPVQALEVTPDKKVVWALREWKDPTNLGPATTIQLLDEPAAPEVLELPK